VGRPISNIRPNIDCPDLEQMITEVVDTVTTMEREVRDRDGHWLLLRVRPYKSLENRIEGAVLVLLDIDAVRRQEERLRLVQEYLSSLLEMVDHPMLVIDGELRVRTANRAFLDTYAVDQRDLVGRSLRDVRDGTFALPAVEDLVERVLREGHARPEELTQPFPGLGGRRLRVSVQRVLSGDARSPAVVVALREGSPA
jgi:two-component system CheB/CheR fusion protein